MSRPCSTCRHPESAAIDVELAAGTPRLAVANRFGLREASVRRHVHEHLPTALRLAAAADRERASRELWDILTVTIVGTRKLEGSALRRRRGRSWLRAVRALRPLLNLRARTLARR